MGFQPAGGTSSVPGRSNVLEHGWLSSYRGEDPGDHHEFEGNDPDAARGLRWWPGVVGRVAVSAAYHDDVIEQLMEKSERAIPFSFGADMILPLIKPTGAETIQARPVAPPYSVK